MKKIECWRLEAISDPGPPRLVARFASSQAATEASSQGWRLRSQIEVESIIIYDKATEFDPTLDEEARISGLAKLTDREKGALRV